jgi:hypothetical protein
MSRAGPSPSGTSRLSDATIRGAAVVAAAVAARGAAVVAAAVVARGAAIRGAAALLPYYHGTRSSTTTVLPRHQEPQ